MRSYTLFQEYTWLVNTIYRAGKISLEDINRKWVDTDMSEGMPMRRSTFSRHKDAIQDMFGIYIECDRRNGFKYYIGNPEVLQEESIQNWMLSTLSVNSVLAESKSVADRILLEQIPSDGEYLHKWIEAMKSGVKVKIKYCKYASEEEKEWKIEPYCVKLFSRRWYGLARFPHHGSYFMIAFDRMLGIELTDDKFEVDGDFDAATWFKDCYGIVKDEDLHVYTVRIRAIGDEAYYLRDLPLHPSQKEVEAGDGWTDFTLNIRPAPDFYTPLLSRGPNIKVIEPEWLAEEIKEQHAKAAALYEK